MLHRFLRLTASLACLAGVTFLWSTAARADVCTPDPGFEWCREHVTGNTATVEKPKLQVDFDFNTANVRGFEVAHQQYIVRFSCNGTLYFNTTSSTCSATGCGGENLGTGVVQKVIDTAYTENAVLPESWCLIVEGSSWSAQGILDSNTGVDVVHCYDDTHCTACGEYCPISLGPTSTWSCTPRPDVCNGADDDCDPSTLDGEAESWWQVPCDGTDTDLCEEGVWDCQGGNQVCTDNTSDTLDTCGNGDDDCNPATLDGSDEPWFRTACDGADTDDCEEGLWQCTGGTQTCDDTTGDNVELCNSTDDNCNGVDNETWPELGMTCTVGVGACERTGTYICDTTSSTACSATPAGPTNEQCDGIDNNCDTFVDEGFPDTDMDGDADCVDDDDDDDGIPDTTDNCRVDANPNQDDNDMDGLGDVCDDDDDDDTVLDVDDNCPLTANTGQADQDGDMIGDVCDDDRDGDGVANDADNCVDVANADQADQDGDMIGDACDDDTDGDSVANDVDNCATV